MPAMTTATPITTNGHATRCSPLRSLKKGGEDEEGANQPEAHEETLTANAKAHR